MTIITGLITILLGAACLYVAQFARHHAITGLKHQSRLTTAAGLAGVAQGCFGLRGNIAAAQLAGAVFHVFLLLSVWRFHQWGELIFRKNHPRPAESSTGEKPHDPRKSSAATI